MALPAASVNALDLTPMVALPLALADGVKLAVYWV